MQPPLPGTQLALSVGAAAPLTTIGDEPVLSSELSLHAVDSMLRLRSAYVLRAGDLLTPAEGHRWRNGVQPATVGRQRIGQQARLQLPQFVGAPLVLALRHEQEDLWLADHAVQKLRQGADLQWAPDVAQLQLHWDAQTLPWDARNALDCSLRGQLSVPVSTQPWNLQLGGRSCAVATPLVDGELSAQAWSAGLQWRGSDQKATLRLQTVRAEMVEALAAEFPAAYEVGLDHERRLGEWAARGGLAWRSGAGTMSAEQAWVADASLRRNLGLTAVMAQWRTGDRYWFLPGEARPSDDLALSLDLSRWTEQLWPGVLPTLALSYQWRLAADGGRDDAVHWRLWLPWR
jgi:hypothetical protein